MPVLGGGGRVGTCKPAHCEGPLCSRYHSVLVQMMLWALRSGRLVLLTGYSRASDLTSHILFPHPHSRDISSIRLIALLGELMK